MYQLRTVYNAIIKGTSSKYELLKTQSYALEMRLDNHVLEEFTFVDFSNICWFPFDLIKVTRLTKQTAKNGTTYVEGSHDIIE